MKLKNLQKGFTMIELMIAVTLGLLLTAAVLHTFINMKRTYEFTEAFSRVQENGRFAIEFLARDIRNAAFWGCNSDGLGSVQNHLNDGGSESYTYDADIEGTNGTPNAGGNTALDDPDTLILRSAADSGIHVEQTPATVSSDLKITENSGLQEGDIVLVSNCESGEIFQITNDPTTGASGFDNVVHNAQGAESPGNVSSSSTDYEAFQTKYGPPDAVIYRATSYEYKVATGTGGLPSLYRNGQELVEGVENFQVMYGDDTDGDGAPNYYVPAGTTGLDMDRVISVQVSLLLASLTGNHADAAQSLEYNGGTYTANDRKIRKVFTTQVTLRNRLN